VSTIIENENIDGSSDFPVEFIAKRAINPTDLQGRGASTTRDKIHFSKKNINNVTIQPNPFSDILHISFGNLEISKVDIMNHLGQIVYFNNEVSEDILNINLANLKSNMYIVRCRDKNGEVMDIQKLIKL
jgi:hypothetical protein